MKAIIVIALLVLCICEGQAQSVSIRGQIKGADNQLAIEFANVVLQTSDSVFVTGTSTDGKGNFRLKDLSPGSYNLLVSSLGYQSATLTLSGLAGPVDVADILLKPAAVELNEVTIRSSAIRTYSDRRIAFPTAEQKAASTNGINLLNSLMLPRLQVNPIQNTVSLPDEGDVQFRINGIRVELNEIRALSPQDVLRVEYHDNPGVRYGDAAVVLDYIVRRRQSGGSVHLDLANSPTSSFGDDLFSVRMNHKQSEFGFQYDLRYRNPYHIWEETTETYRYADGHTLERQSKGLPSGMSEKSHNFTFNYSWVETDKQYLNVTLRHSLSDDSKGGRSQLYSPDRPDDFTSVWNPRTNETRRPSLDLYYLRHLGHKQTLTLNVVGTSIRTHSNQTYQETQDKTLLSDILSEIEGKKYSLIGEGIYEKAFTPGRLSAGLKHTQAWTDNTYSGTVDGRAQMDQSETYLYAEFSGKVEKLQYAGGVGVSRSWFRQKGEDEYTYYTFRPQFTLQYAFTEQMFLRLNGSIDNTSPSLSDLSAVEQYLDTLQIRRGNPSLNPYRNYRTALTYEYRKGLFTGDLNLAYSRSHHPIMEETQRENDKFIRITANQVNWQKANGDATLRIGPLWQILQVSLTGGLNHYISNGNTYSHTYTNAYFRASVMAMYKKFMAMFQIQTHYDQFIGETAKTGENTHLFMVRYNAGRFAVGGGILMPFASEYKRLVENKSASAPYILRSFANDFSRMIMLTFSWNMDFGRTFKASEKKLHNSDTDAGILSR